MDRKSLANRPILDTTDSNSYLPSSNIVAPLSPYRSLRASGPYVAPTIIPDHVGVVLAQQDQIKLLESDRQRLADSHHLLRQTALGTQEENSALRQALDNQNLKLSQVAGEASKHEADKRLYADANNQLQSENQRLRQHLVDTDNLRIAHANLQADHAKLNDHANALRADNDNLRRRQVDLENRVVDHDNLALRHKVAVDDAEKLRNHANVLAQDNNNLRVRNEELGRHVGDLENARRSIQLLTNDNENLRRNIADNDALRNKISLITAENERVARLYQDRLGDIDTLKKQYADLHNRHLDCDSHQIRLRAATDDNERLKQGLAASLNENNTLRSHIADHEALRNRLQLVTGENERVARLYQDRVAENDALRKRLADHDLTHSDYEGMRTRNAVLHDENNRLRQTLLERHADVEALSKRISGSSLYDSQLAAQLAGYRDYNNKYLASPYQKI
jgi:hypothetical protein